MKNIVLDVDTGIDDAMAIMLAATWSKVRLLGIACVSGNVALDQVVANTQGVLQLVGRPDVPVARGAEMPLVEKPRNSSNVHGDDGLAGFMFEPDPEKCADLPSAIDLYRSILEKKSEPVVFVALAPLTNLALFIRSFPSLAKKIDGIVFMGGAIGAGNASSVAEFNVWHDPEAAHIVLTSGIPVTMYSLDAFNGVEVTPQEIEDLNKNELTLVLSRLLNFERTLSDGSRGPRFGLIGDAGALISAVEPQLAISRQLPIHVNLSPGIGRGQTQADLRQVEGEDSFHGQVEDWPIIDVVLELDRSKAIELFLSTIGEK